MKRESKMSSAFAEHLAKRLGTGWGLLTVAAGLVTMTLVANGVLAAELLIGAATTSITPDQPVALAGQFNTRISKGVDNPVTATAVAIEVALGRSGGGSGDPGVPRFGHGLCRRSSSPAGAAGQEAARLRRPQAGAHRDAHAHRAGHRMKLLQASRNGRDDTAAVRRLPRGPAGGGRRQRVEAAQAGRRQPGAWDMPSSATTAARSTPTARPRCTVRPIARTSAAWKRARTTAWRSSSSGTRGSRSRWPWAINVACPSQEVEGLSTINADFWHDVRQQLQVGPWKDLLVLGWPGAAGDISPHRMYRKVAEERMVKLRGLSYTQEIGRRIVGEVHDVGELVRGEVRTDVPFVHKVEELALPRRKVTEQEAAAAQAAGRRPRQEERDRPEQLAAGCRRSLPEAG